MDIDRILKHRSNRQLRGGKPWRVFHSHVEYCRNASQTLLSKPLTEHSVLLERAIIITMVSAIEVYYRDVLDGIFRFCSEEFYRPQLKKLHTSKYDIEELYDLHYKQIHPLELISANQSFQAADAIDRVFSNFLGKSLWSSLWGLTVRAVKEGPPREQTEEVTFTADLLDDLKRLFTLRHELVHDPAIHNFFTEQTASLIVSASFLVFGSDLVLMTMIREHADPERFPKDEDARPVSSG